MLHCIAYSNTTNRRLWQRKQSPVRKVERNLIAMNFPIKKMTLIELYDCDKLLSCNCCFVHS